MNKTILDIIIYLKENNINLKINEIGNLEIIFKGEKINEEILLKIKDNKNEIISFILDNRTKNHIELKRSTNDIYPTTAYQKAHWIKYKYIKTWIPENGIVKIFLDKNIDLANIEAVILSLINKHSILRCKYVYQENELFQIPSELYKEYSVDRHENIPNLKGVDDVFNFIFTEEVNVKMDITSGMLMRSCFIEAPHQNILLLTIDQSAFDRYSANIIEKDFWYALSSKNYTQVSNSDGGIQYTDYADSLNNHLNNVDVKSQLSNFWIKYLKNHELILLCTDFPYNSKKINLLNYDSALRNEINMYCTNEALNHIPFIKGKQSKMELVPGSLISFSIDKDLLLKIKEFAKNKNTTLYCYFLTLFKILLYTESNSTVITIGNCVSLRNNIDLDDVIGYFNNIIFTQIELSDDQSFEELLEIVSNDFRTCLRFKEFPWENVLADTDIPFNVISTLFLDYINLEGQMFKDQLHSTHKTGAVSIFDLNIIMQEYSNMLIIQVMYSDLLFLPETIELLIKKIIMYNDQIMHFPTIKINKLG